jgi:hypothetical protein
MGECWRGCGGLCGCGCGVGVGEVALFEWWYVVFTNLEVLKLERLVLVVVCGGGVGM